jgi:hypothetical protein
MTAIGSVPRKFPSLSFLVLALAVHGTALANRAPGGAVQNRRWAGWLGGSRI